jgi:benzoate/toluate 1,2-dioxygenase alpha subunit
MDLQHIKLYIDDRTDEGVFRVHKDVFSDPEVFEMEMKHIFERTWNFLVLESQVAKPHDFFTTWIGRTPVMIARDAKGNIGGFTGQSIHVSGGGYMP